MPILERYPHVLSNTSKGLYPWACMGFFLKYADISVGASTEVSGFLTPLLATM